MKIYQCGRCVAAILNVLVDEGYVIVFNFIILYLIESD